MSDVYIDGKLKGKVSNPKDFRDKVVELRRTSKLSKEINLRYSETEDALFIFTDKSRVRRPLIVVKDGKAALTPEHLKGLEDGSLSWKDLVDQGIIEQIDAAEEDDTYIALKPEDLTKEHTHLEIDPLSIFSICTSMVPYANYNQSSRLNRGSKTQKQAMGLYALNYLNRMDTSVNLLKYPQRPIVRSFTQEFFGRDKTAGQNIVIAVMNYEGYNMNDAVVVNRASVERGFGKSAHYRPYDAEKLRYAAGQTDDITIPDKDVQGYRTEYDYRFLDEDGIISPEVEVSEGDVLIGKTSPPRFLGKLESFSAAANVRKETSVKVRSGESGVISKVVLTESLDGNLLIRVNVRESRTPELGDKFSSRHGQKGIIGLFVDPENLPFSADGIIPDIIFSPNSLPTRMTLGHMIEMLGGKVGSLAAREIDGTPFRSESAESLRKELLDLGFKDDGTELLYDGRTGKAYDARIFIGNMYYLRLKYQVTDKIQARARGPVQLLTRQPTEGKAKEGGLRLGEMEKEALVGHGASLLIKERFSSDRTVTHICEKCGDIAVYDKYKQKSFCLICGDKATVAPIEMSYAFKLFLDELKSMGIRPKLKLKDKY